MLMIFGAVWGLFSRPIPLVPDRAALVVAPQGPLVEQLTGDPLERVLAESLRQLPSETLLHGVVDAIESAADDSRISVLYLDVGGMSGASLAKLQELGRAIEVFRASGKPVVAYGDLYDQRQYYLAAHADEVYLDPQGLVYVDGFANYGMFVKDAIDKLSIDWNVFRVGEYKSAVEMFSRNDMSPAEREESLVWLGTLWRTYKDDVAKARGFAPDLLQSYADDAVEALRRADGSLAQMALDAGLVTALEGRYAVEERLALLTGEDENDGTYVGVGHEAYLANLRSQRVLGRRPRQQGQRHRGGGRDRARRAAARHDRLRHARLAAARRAGRRRGQGRRAAHRQSGRERVRERSRPPGSGGAARGRQAGRGLDERAGGLGRVLHRHGRRPHRGEPSDADRLDRHLRDVPDLPADARAARRAQRRRRHDGAVRGVPRRSRARRDLPLDPAAEHRVRIPPVHRPRGAGPRQDRRSRSMRWRRGASGRAPTRSSSASWTSSEAIPAPSNSPRNSPTSATITTVDFPEASLGLGQMVGLRIRASVAGLIAPLLPASVLAPIPQALTPLLAEARRLARLADPRSLFAYCIACVAE